MQAKHPATIDAYIATFPASVQERMQAIRKLVHELDGNVTETIKYGMPTFMKGANLVYFAGYKNHIGFYPAPVKDAAFTKALSVYKTGRGSVQFPHDKPLPLALVKRMIRLRLQQVAQPLKKKA